LNNENLRKQMFAWLSQTMATLTKRDMLNRREAAAAAAGESNDTSKQSAS